MSVILVTFPNAPKVSEAAIQKVSRSTRLGREVALAPRGWFSIDHWFTDGIHEPLSTCVLLQPP